MQRLGLEPKWLDDFWLDFENPEDAKFACVRAHSFAASSLFGHSGMCTITSDHWNLEQDDLASKFVQQLAITNEPAASNIRRDWEAQQACIMQSAMLSPPESENKKRGRGGPSHETPDAKQNRGEVSEIDVDPEPPAQNN